MEESFTHLAAETWAVYAGLGGGFGGVSFSHFAIGSLDDVMEEAYRTACECYSSYEGLYGLATFNDCLDEAENDEEYAEELYNGEMESWIMYDVVPYQQAIEDGDATNEEFKDFITKTLGL